MKTIKVHSVLSIFLLAAALLALPAAAKKKNVTDFPLEYLPQQAVAAAEVDIRPNMWDTPIRLEIKDARPGELDEIGSRTDDDDRRYVLRATNEVQAFAEEASVEAFEDWSLHVQDDATLALVGKLRTFDVDEANQAVGAFYAAKVRLSFELKKGGKVLWEGTATGDASRYGKKFSNANCNEVLSDALLEALADALNSPGLQEAWK